MSPERSDGDDELALEMQVDGLLVAPANSCQRLLSWDCAARERADPERLAQALLARGYANESQWGWLRELKNAEGHRVVLVPRTGRVQLRVHYLTPFEARAACARLIAQDVARALRDAADAPTRAG